MLSKTTYAAAGIALVCAAGYSVNVFPTASSASGMVPPATMQALKQDRLAFNGASTGSATAIAFNLPAADMTVVTRTADSVVVSSVQKPRATSAPVSPVRDVPNEARRERLPEGCEPAFSAVTMPAYAHIGVRCDS